jgi:hypothetical protein
MKNFEKPTLATRSTRLADEKLLPILSNELSKIMITFETNFVSY